MRKLSHLALALAGAFLFVPSCRAQFTTVNATVTDPNGIPYVGAVMNAILVPGSSGGYTLSGKPYSGRIGPVTLDSAGSFSQNFGDVTLITPSGAQWAITIDSAAGTIGPPLGTGPQSFTFTSSGTTISGSSPVSLSASLTAAAKNLTNINVSATLQKLTVIGPCGGSVSQFAFPTCVHITVAGLPATDISGLCIDDSNLAGQSICAVMKSNGQTEWLVGGNTSGVGGNCVADLEVNSLGNVMALGPVVGNPCDNDLTTINGNIHLSPGTSGNTVDVDSGFLTGPIAAQGSGATVTGTGICATFAATVSKGFAIDAVCNSGTTGVATVVITPPAGSPTPAQSLHCWGSDTGPAGSPGTHLVFGVQASQGSATCTVNFSSVTNGDYLSLHWEIL